MGLHAPNFQQTCPKHDFDVNKILEYKHNVWNMNVIRYKDWYVGTKNMMEKEDVTVCMFRSKVVVKTFYL